MNARNIIGFLISLISILGVNFIPLEMFLYRDFSAESAMVFYALENVAAIVFAVVFVALFAPAKEENPDFAHRDEILKQNPGFAVERVRKKSEILQGYLVFSIGFSAGSLVFLTAFIFIVLKTHIQIAAVVTGFYWIIGFQCLEFLGDLLTRRPLSLAKSETYLKQSMGRVALLFLAVFIGIFLALFVDRWFVVPFIALKTITDIAGLLQNFGSRFKPLIP